MPQGPAPFVGFVLACARGGPAPDAAGLRAVAARMQAAAGAPTTVHRRGPLAVVRVAHARLGFADDGGVVVVGDMRLEPADATAPLEGTAAAAWLLERWQEQGSEALDALQGRFALAVHDARAGLLVLARDGTGTRRLHVHEGPRGVLAGSAARLLAAHPTIADTIDEGHVARLLVGPPGVHQAPTTPWRDLRRHAPGMRTTWTARARTTVTLPEAARAATAARRDLRVLDRDGTPLLAHATHAEVCAHLDRVLGALDDPAAARLVGGPSWALAQARHQGRRVVLAAAGAVSTGAGRAPSPLERGLARARAWQGARRQRREADARLAGSDLRLGRWGTQALRDDVAAALGEAPRHPDPTLTLEHVVDLGDALDVLVEVPGPDTRAVPHGASGTRAASGAAGAADVRALLLRRAGPWLAEALADVEPALAPWVEPHVVGTVLDALAGDGTASRERAFTLIALGRAVRHAMRDPGRRS